MCKILLIKEVKTLSNNILFFFFFGYTEMFYIVWRRYLRIFLIWKYSIQDSQFHEGKNTQILARIFNFKNFLLAETQTYRSWCKNNLSSSHSDRIMIDGFCLHFIGKARTFNIIEEFKKRKNERKKKWEVGGVLQTSFSLN